MIGFAAFAGLPSSPRGRWLFAAILAICVVGAGVFWWSSLPGQGPGPDDPDPPYNGPFYFEDMTDRSGVAITYRNGQEAGQLAILESLGGGVALIDYDGDGLLDIFVPGGGYLEVDKTRNKNKDRDEITAVKGLPCKLYKNLGNFRFKDVTAEAGLDKIDFYTHGCAVADYNRDGWPDLLVTGWGRVALFRNDPVDPQDPRKGRRFREVTEEARLTGCAWTTSAAWADLNGDGFPDLYLCQYVDWSPQNNPKCPAYTPKYPRDVCPPREFKGREHLLFRNNGDGTFTNATRSAGLNVYGKKEMRGGKLEQVVVGKGLGVIALDLNNDGRPDIYVANDTVPKLLYMNRTRAGFFDRAIRLEEAADRLGLALDDGGVPNGSMGLAAADFDGSGFASLFVTNYENEMHGFYKNRGAEVFSFDTNKLGILAIGQQYVGFGTSFLDLDNRGWEDIVITNGHVIRFPNHTTIKQRPVLFNNQEGKRFEAVTDRGGPFFQKEHTGRGLAVGDLDNDGRPDLAFSPLNEPVAILRNVAGDSGTRNHWLGLELVGRDYRDIVGSRIVVEAGKRRRTRFVIGGGSYLSAGDPRHIFGLGELEMIDRVTVYWSWGKAEVIAFDNFKADRYWLIREGQGKAAKWLPRNQRP